MRTEGVFGDSTNETFPHDFPGELRAGSDEVYPVGGFRILGGLDSVSFFPCPSFFGLVSFFPNILEKARELSGVFAPFIPLLYLPSKLSLFGLPPSPFSSSSF
jgi:hypothetical protein